MRQLAWVVVFVVGCSESKKQDSPAPAPAPAPARPAQQPATPPTPAPTPAPPPANRNAENLADLTITGEWQVTIKGGGAYCRFNNDPKEREMDRGARIKVDTRKVGAEGRWASFSLHTDSAGKVTLIQVDVETDEFATGSTKHKKNLTYTKNEKGAQITKAEVAPDGSSATIDATLGSLKKDG
ncbi:MAG TPA: hypothetical protein VIV11_37285, partial [Kofleriaceae bacterium]